MLAGHDVASANVADATTNGGKPTASDQLFDIEWRQTCIVGGMLDAESATGRERNRCKRYSGCSGLA